MDGDIKQKVEEIIALENDVRMHINTTRYQNDFIKDGDNWNQICCSLDTIGDTLYAVDDYVDSEYPEEIGLKYVFTYGLLQALFIQQDAISHLSESFGIEYSHSDKLKEIRLLRSAAIGHPTKQDRGTSNGYTHYNYISRVTLSKGGFTLMQSYDQGKINSVDVELLLIISDQLDEIKSAYNTIANKLKEVDKMHKEKYKDDLLVNIFHSSMGYNFQKIAQAIHLPNSSNTDFGLSKLNIIQETYDKFERALKERGDLEEDVQTDLDEYKHALSKLEVYFNDGDSGMLKSDANVYYYYVTEQHKYFEKIAKDIDDSYEDDQS